MAYNLRTGLIGSGDIDVNVSLSGLTADNIQSGTFVLPRIPTLGNDKGTRFSSFRRVGATVDGAQPPAHVDIMPFVAAVRRMWPGEPVGPWLGHLSIATELYDYVVGEVTFAGPPTIAAHPRS